MALFSAALVFLIKLGSATRLQYSTATLCFSFNYLLGIANLFQLTSVPFLFVIFKHGQVLSFVAGTRIMPIFNKVIRRGHPQSLPPHLFLDARVNPEIAAAYLHLEDSTRKHESNSEWKPRHDKTNQYYIDSFMPWPLVSCYPYLLYNRNNDCRFGPEYPRDPLTSQYRKWFCHLIRLVPCQVVD